MTNYICNECGEEWDRIPSWGYCDGSLACSWDDSTLVWVGEGTDPRL